MSDRGRGVLFAVLALAWAGAIFWASSQPYPFPMLPRALLSKDKVVHLVAYAVLGGLVRAAIAAARLGTRRALVMAAALAAIYGLTDEWHQAHVPNRTPEGGDLVADALGALAGAAATGVILRRREARARVRA